MLGCVLNDQEEIVDNCIVGTWTVQIPLRDLYNTLVILKLLLLHLMRLMTTCSIHNKETSMWDRG